MRISDWSSDVCLPIFTLHTWATPNGRKISIALEELGLPYELRAVDIGRDQQFAPEFLALNPNNKIPVIEDSDGPCGQRSEEHTSELQSLMRISYAVFCLKKKKRTEYKSSTAIRKQRTDYKKIQHTFSYSQTDA